MCAVLTRLRPSDSERLPLARLSWSMCMPFSVPWDGERPLRGASRCERWPPRSTFGEGRMGGRVFGSSSHLARRTVSCCSDHEPPVGPKTGVGGEACPARRAAEASRSRRIRSLFSVMDRWAASVWFSLHGRGGSSGLDATAPPPPSPLEGADPPIAV